VLEICAEVRMVDLPYYYYVVTIKDHTSCVFRP